MAIQTVSIPASAEGIKYGRTTFRPDENGGIDVPSYVAKRLLTVPGVTGAAVPQSTDALLAAVDEEFECNYLFWAFGLALPEEGRVTAARALLAANGEPAVALL